MFMLCILTDESIRDPLNDDHSYSRRSDTVEPIDKGKNDFKYDNKHLYSLVNNIELYSK